MNICLVGDFSENLDEGYKNTSHYLADGLAVHHTVLRLNAKEVAGARFWRDVARARPSILHVITQPTLQSLLLIHLLRHLWPQSHTVISALRAERFFVDGQITPRHRRLMRSARPDLVLIQTPEAADLFKQLGCCVAQLPNGVDTERFRPATKARQRELRRRYRLDPDRPVVLHVGHLRTARNLPALEALPKAQIQAVVAGSTYMGTDRRLVQRLTSTGICVLEGYQPRIEELYMLADCYVFPPQPGDSLTMPLSVLEAMACNLPVVSMPYPGLVHAFGERNGLRFIGHADDLVPHVHEVLASQTPPATRQMVEACSWQSVVGQLQLYYRGLASK
jgi:glycosyltransferase involved in cell wall biosynthesis